MQQKWSCKAWVILSPFLAAGGYGWVHYLQDGSLRPQKSVQGKDYALKPLGQWWLVGVGSWLDEQVSEGYQLLRGSERGTGGNRVPGVCQDLQEQALT